MIPPITADCTVVAEFAKLITGGGGGFGGYWNFGNFWSW